MAESLECVVRLRDDRRGRRVIFLSHCLLNQNTKVYGIAMYPGAVVELVRLALDEGWGIVQMPCPEASYWGLKRWAMTRDQYNIPRFREHCRSIALDVVYQIIDYLESGYEVLAIVGCDGSPVCGVNWTNKRVGKPWGGFITEERLRSPPRQLVVPGKGVFIEILRDELERYGLKIPFLAYPEFKEVGNVDTLVKKLKEIAEQRDRQSNEA